MKDSHGRRLEYARFSITDRCNLACVYCTSSRRQRHIPHDRILRYEQIFRLAAVLGKLGMRKARITGGEPLVRKGALGFMAEFRRRFPDISLAMTTNGLLLGDMLAEIAALGLSSVNVSLDSFDEAIYERLTGSPGSGVVAAAVERLLSLGQKVKINVVALKGITDARMGDYVHAIREMPVDIRFIEYMPMGANTVWDKSNYISCQELRTIAGAFGFFAPDPDAPGPLDGPARMYAMRGAKGRFGYISAISSHFCASCQRARITSDGNLRACLFADREVALAPLLRNPKISDGQLANVIRRGFARKPLGFELLARRMEGAVALKQMVGIGG